MKAITVIEKSNDNSLDKIDNINEWKVKFHSQLSNCHIESIRVFACLLCCVGDSVRFSGFKNDRRKTVFDQDD